VQIDVVEKNGSIEHHLVEINSKNIVYLNDKPIERGDILILKFGDKMTLGKTDIYLEETSDEATQIKI
jgi:pSer/pThr/pTyr-binding forkhead associated (FHA) protein